MLMDSEAKRSSCLCLGHHRAFVLLVNMPLSPCFSLVSASRNAALAVGRLSVLGLRSPPRQVLYAVVKRVLLANTR